MHDQRDDRCILIVEDNAIEREGMARLLRRAGYTVILAENGQEGFDSLCQQRPRLVLLDMLMPLSDGWDFLAKKGEAQEWATIPVIVVTSLTVANREWALGIGAQDFLAKPVQPEALLRKVKQHGRC